MLSADIREELTQILALTLSNPAAVYPRLHNLLTRRDLAPNIATVQGQRYPWNSIKPGESFNLNYRSIYPVRGLAARAALRTGFKYDIALGDDRKHVVVTRLS